MLENIELYKGKRVDNGEWVEGYYCRAFRWTGDKEPVPAIQEADCYYFRAIIPETVGRYSYLTDKNGTRIFEGDILGAKHPNQKKAVPCLVKYGEYEDEDGRVDCRYLGFYLEVFGKCCSILTPLSDGIEYEVIGNIFDNKELLEVTP